MSDTYTLTMDAYTLTMDAETARVVSRACEFYARILMGQWEELSWEMILRDETYAERRPVCEAFIERARMAAFPDLVRGQYYGVGHDRKADTAWQTHEVIRNAMAWHEHPEGGITVNFDKPMRVSDAPMPKCEVQEAQP